MKVALAIAFVIIATLALLSSGIGSSLSHGSTTSTLSNQNNQRLIEAANYVDNRYDVRVGLVSESEDAGSNVPDSTSCYRTFWVYSDNLWASEALKPFYPEVASNISESLKPYTNDLEGSQLFEVVLGRSIPTPIHAGSNLKVATYTFDGTNYTVWEDRHTPEDGGIFYDAQQYADLCFYLSLDYALDRNKIASERWFRIGESFWNGHGFLDKAANESASTDDNKRYQNYKLGLYLFTVRATGFNSSIYNVVENTAWSYQEENGGIAAQSYLNGTIYGTANVETTSILLLAYNDEVLAGFANMNALKIGAYYYAWWGIASNPHWDQGVKYTPLLGHYNSSDPTVADEQILMAKQHGIDFFTVSWIGNGNWTPPDQDFRYVNENLENGLLKAPHLSNFSFCLLYETKLVLDEANKTGMNFTDIFIKDLEYAANQYFTNPSYLRINGKPVLFIYQLPYLHNNALVSVKDLLDSARKQFENTTGIYLVGDTGNYASINDVNATWLYSMDAITSYHYLDSSNRWDEILGNASANYPEWRSILNSKGIKFIPNAYPGFDNTENRKFQNPSSEGAVLPLDEIMFKQMLDIATNYSDSNPKIVMITSWNEWLESTAIEPSVEYGELFLDQVSNIVPEFPPITFAFSFVLATMFIIIIREKKRIKRRQSARTREATRTSSFPS